MAESTAPLIRPEAHRLESQDVELVSMQSSTRLVDGKSIAHEQRVTRPAGAVRRISLQGVGILLAASVLICGVLGLITFLWTGTSRNSFWHYIVVHGGANTAVTVSALALRTAANLQAGVSVAMLAALLLETDYPALLTDSARLSKLRAGSAGTLDLIYPYLSSLRFRPWKARGGMLYFIAIPLLAAVTAVIQLTSTILVSDLSLGPLLGSNTQRAPAYDFNYMFDDDFEEWVYPVELRQSHYWVTNPPVFPTFGEYSEAPDISDHVDDTGRLFRALLPFQDAQTRETLGNYSGKALVFDARVSCQPPNLDNLVLKGQNSTAWVLNGSFSNSVALPRLVNPAKGVPFRCALGPIAEESGIYSTLSICQSPGPDLENGMLVSELRDLDANNTLINSGSYQGKSAVASYFLLNATCADKGCVHGDNFTGTSEHGAWTDLSWTSSERRTSTNISISLCYPAFWVARLDVDLHSDVNRTEPVTRVDIRPGRNAPFDMFYRTVPDIHVQMGELQRHATEKTDYRGILAMSPLDSWLPSTADAAPFADGIIRPFLVDAEGMGPRNTSLSWGFDPNSDRLDIWTGLSPDPSLAAIFTTSLKSTNGSAATALSTILTVIANMAYQDQMASMKQLSDVQMVLFETVLYPQSFRGFTAVVVVFALHLALVAGITIAFLVVSRHTMLGNHWQTVAHLVSPETEEIMTQSSRLTDKEVRTLLKRGQREKETVVLKSLQDEQKVGVVKLRSLARRQSS